MKKASVSFAISAPFFGSFRHGIDRCRHVTARPRTGTGTGRSVLSLARTGTGTAVLAGPDWDRSPVSVRTGPGPIAVLNRSAPVLDWSWLVPSAISHMYVLKSPYVVQFWVTYCSISHFRTKVQRKIQTKANNDRISARKRSRHRSFESSKTPILMVCTHTRSVSSTYTA